MQFPVKTIKISQGWGANPAYYRQFGQRGHNGIDFAVPTGTPVYAAEAGTIYFEGYGAKSAWMGSISGICCIINHGKLYTGYAHLKDTVVNKGQKVKRGQLIGHADSTGISTGPHLHFEVIGKPPAWNNGYAARVVPPVLTPYGTVVNTVKKAVATVVAVIPRYYKVRRGDTMSKIAKAYGLSLSALARLNPKIKNLNLIYVNQVIRVK